MTHILTCDVRTFFTAIRDEMTPSGSSIYVLEPQRTDDNCGGPKAILGNTLRPPAAPNVCLAATA